MGDKTAIILAGGGMRSAHGAGFLYALAKNLRITSPNVMIGSSGDAGNMMYFVSGQYESLKRVWLNLLSTPDFISYSRLRNIMNVDYLIDTVFKKQDPLRVEALIQSSIDWAVSVTNYDTGASRYITAADRVDPFEILRTSKAVPFLYGKRISLFGGRYFDGELGPTAEDHINYCVEKGAKRILLISDNPPRTRFTTFFTRLYSFAFPSPLRHAVMRDSLTQTTCLTLPDTMLVCVIPKLLPAGVATRDKHKLQETFDKGVADALALEKELRTLFDTAI